VGVVFFTVFCRCQETVLEALPKVLSVPLSGCFEFFKRIRMRLFHGTFLFREHGNIPLDQVNGRAVQVFVLDTNRMPTVMCVKGHCHEATVMCVKGHCHEAKVMCVKGHCHEAKVHLFGQRYWCI
jgi:hypothetical protein